SGYAFFPSDCDYHLRYHGLAGWCDCCNSHPNFSRYQRLAWRNVWFVLCIIVFAARHESGRRGALGTRVCANSLVGDSGRHRSFADGRHARDGDARHSASTLPRTDCLSALLRDAAGVGAWNLAVADCGLAIEQSEYIKSAIGYCNNINAEIQQLTK